MKLHQLICDLTKTLSPKLGPVSFHFGPMFILGLWGELQEATLFLYFLYFCQVCSTWLQDGCKMAQHSSKMVQHSSKMAQHSSKMRQHVPKLAQLRPTWSSNPRFLKDFEGHVGSQNGHKNDVYRKHGKK